MLWTVALVVFINSAFLYQAMKPSAILPLKALKNTIIFSKWHKGMSYKHFAGISLEWYPAEFPDTTDQALHTQSS